MLHTKYIVVEQYDSDFLIKTSIRCWKRNTTALWKPFFVVNAFSSTNIFEQTAFNITIINYGFTVNEHKSQMSVLLPKSVVVMLSYMNLIVLC